MDPASTAAPSPRLVDGTPARVPWLAVAVYAVLACGLAWLVVLPVWLSGDGLASPLFLPLAAAMMATPAIAALVVTFWIVRPTIAGRTYRARYLGLTPIRPIRRKLLLVLLAPVAFLAIGYAAFGLALLLGWADADWSLAAFVVPGAGLPPEVLLAITVATLPLGVVTSTVTALGEELGWRGFLTTALAPMGFWPSAVVSGVLWGVWHAPVILLGYNFQRTDLSGVALMCGFTILVGILLQWMRWTTRSVWTAAFGHGALNATAAMTLLFLAVDADPATSGLLGVPGWIVLAAVVVVLVATGLLGRRMPRPLVLVPVPDTATASDPGGSDAVDDAAAVGSRGEAHQMVTRASGDSQSASPSRTENAS